MTVLHWEQWELLDALFLVRRRDRIDLGISDGVLKSKGFSARDKQALQGKSGLSV